MAMIKGTAQVSNPAVESGAEAALERLSKPKAEAKPAFKQRDYDQENRGKVRCVMFESALQSPALAGLRFDDIEGFLALVEKAADAGVKYTWKE
jgi:hypothetical protein